MRRTFQTLAHPRLADPSTLTRIAEQLVRELGAESVIVYGSVARGEATADSDVDLLVVAPSGEDHAHRLGRVRKAIRDVRVDVPVAPLVLTPDELRRQLEADNRFIRQIIETGVELGAPPGYDARRRWGGIRPMAGARPSESWRRQARRDWEQSQYLLDGGYADGASYSLQQALEKFLKGWLLEQGWQLQKTHLIEQLLDDACAYDPALVSFRPLGERISKYLPARYPDSGVAAPSEEQVRLDAGEARLLVRALFPDESLP